MGIEPTPETREANNKKPILGRTGTLVLRRASTAFTQQIMASAISAQQGGRLQYMQLGTFVGHFGSCGSPHSPMTETDAVPSVVEIRMPI
jgi:hypothetical protein